MVASAGVLVAVGMAFLAGQAAVTREGYRRAMLQSMLRTERYAAQEWKHEQAQFSTPFTLDQKAAQQGMVRADEKDVVLVGQAESESVSNGHTKSRHRHVSASTR